MEQLISNTSGIINANINTLGQKLKWRIKPNIQSDKILFVFKSLVIKSAELRIYDYNQPTGSFFDCILCQTYKNDYGPLMVFNFNYSSMILVRINYHLNYSHPLFLPLLER